MNYVISNNQRFTASGCKDTEIQKLEFVAKTQFLCTVVSTMYTANCN